MGLEVGELLVHRHRRTAELGGEKTGEVVEIHVYPSFLTQGVTRRASSRASRK